MTGIIHTNKPVLIPRTGYPEVRRIPSAPVKAYGHPKAGLPVTTRALSRPLGLRWIWLPVSGASTLRQTLSNSSLTRKLSAFSGTLPVYGYDRSVSSVQSAARRIVEVKSQSMAQDARVQMSDSQVAVY